MSFGQIRLIADQIVVALNPNDSGALVFEEGTVNGETGLTLRSALIGDLSVETIQIGDAAVTVPAINLVTSQQTNNTTSFVTFIEDEFVTKGVAGSDIVLQLQNDMILQHAGGGSGMTVIVQCLLNNSTVIESFTQAFTGNDVPHRTVKFVVASVAADGTDQTINLKWQFKSSTGGFNGYVNSAIDLRIAMKR